MADRITGFEFKPLRAVIENWLYTTDVDVIADTAYEMRRRLSKTFPRPKWAIRNENNGKITNR